MFSLPDARKHVSFLLFWRSSRAALHLSTGPVEIIRNTYKNRLVKDVSSRTGTLNNSVWLSLRTRIFFL